MVEGNSFNVDDYELQAVEVVESVKMLQNGLLSGGKRLFCSNKKRTTSNFFLLPLRAQSASFSGTCGWSPWLAFINSL